MSRKEFPAKIKLAAFERCGGRCELCTAKLFPGNINYDFDHRIPAGLRGLSDLANCLVLCRSCHRQKTKTDVAVIAKAKRIERQHAGIRKPRTIVRWRRFDGSPVYAPRER